LPASAVEGRLGVLLGAWSRLRSTDCPEQEDQLRARGNTQQEAPMANAITVWRTQPIPLDERGRRNGCRSISPDPGAAWDGVVLSEWELERAGWQDRHPHDETTYLLQGTVVVLRPGDCATVRAGQLGRYIARDHARMLAIYGPNRDGAGSGDFLSWSLGD
jgi:uncharacterized cupin superfamily protein